jgi:hypothetical protein
MKQLFTIFLLILSLSFISSSSGCCSYHSGVCGTQCCDNTPLSKICEGIILNTTSPPPTPAITNPPQIIQCEIKNTTYCDNTLLLQTSQNATCTNTTTLLEFCSYKCENVTCIEAPVETPKNEEPQKELLSETNLIIGSLILVLLLAIACIVVWWWNYKR